MKPTIAPVVRSTIARGSHGWAVSPDRNCQSRIAANSRTLKPVDGMLALSWVAARARSPSAVLRRKSGVSGRRLRRAVAMARLSTGERATEAEEGRGTGFGVGRGESMRAEVFADAVNEEFDLAAVGAVVDVEIFFVHEEFTEVAHDALPGAFVESFGAGVGERDVATQAADFAGTVGLERVLSAVRRSDSARSTASSASP